MTFMERELDYHLSIYPSVSKITISYARAEIGEKDFCTHSKNNTESMN